MSAVKSQKSGACGRAGLLALLVEEGEIAGRNNSEDSTVEMELTSALTLARAHSYSPFFFFASARRVRRAAVVKGIACRKGHMG